MNTELLYSILGMGYFAVLKPTEGIIVHKDGKAYVIHMDNEQVKITEDNELLQYKDRSWVWMHDEPVGNA